MTKALESRGIGSAILAAFLFGISTPIAKGLLSNISPQLLAGLFYLGSGLGLAALWILLRRKTSLEASLTRKDLPWLSGASVFGGILGPMLLLLGLQTTFASMASLLLNLEAVFTAILAWTLFHEHSGRKFTLGMAAILAGSALVSWQGSIGETSLFGPLAVAGACLCWAIDNNMTQKVSSGDPRQIGAIKGLAAGAVNTTLGIGLQNAWPSPPLAAASLLIGFFCYGLGIMFFVISLRTLGTARTAAYFSSAPFVGAVGGLLIWGEPVTQFLIFGSVSMAIGVLLCVTERHEHIHTHETIYHDHRHVHDVHHHHEHSPDQVDHEPHSHPHLHKKLVHSHGHNPDIHHRHCHEK